MSRSSRPRRRRPSVRAPVGFDPAFAEAATRKLVMLIGPIANVVAKRAMKQTGDRQEFLTLLASHIDSSVERAGFLADAGAL